MGLKFIFVGPPLVFGFNFIQLHDPHMQHRNSPWPNLSPNDHLSRSKLLTQAPGLLEPDLDQDFCIPMQCNASNKRRQLSALSVFLSLRA